MLRSANTNYLIKVKVKPPSCLQAFSNDFHLGVEYTCVPSPLLSVDVLLRVFHWLEIHDVCRCACVCKFWNFVLGPSSPLWVEKALEKGWIQQSGTQNDLPPKGFYAARHDIVLLANLFVTM